MTRHRWYVGLVTRIGLVLEPVVYTKILDRHLKGYTIYGAQGRWEGQNEAALIIEVIGELDTIPGKDGTWLAKELKYFGDQNTVLYTQDEVQTTFV